MKKQAERAREFDPSNAASYAFLGAYEFRMRRLDMAERLYEKALLRDRRYYDPAFLANRKKGAAWGSEKVGTLRPLIQIVPKPVYPY